MINITKSDVHEEENNSSNYAIVDSEAQISQAKSKLTNSNHKSSLSHRATILPKDEAYKLLQNRLSQDSVPSTIIFCATPPHFTAKKKEKEEDVTLKFIHAFNARRGNQELLAKAYKMLYNTRCLAGLEANSGITDIPSARANFLLLSQLNHQDIKLAALDNLILVLQKDEVTKETAFDLISLAIELMKQLDKELIQTQLIEEQIKISRAYGMIAELIQWHYGKKHFNGVTEELKRQLIRTIKSLEDLNTQDNIELHFTVTYALEGFKRLKDDKKELFDLGQRIFHGLVGLISVYNDAPNIHELINAFADIDINYKHSWYDLTLLFNDLAKGAYTNLNQLTAIEWILEQNWMEQNWKFLYNALQKFSDISIHGSTPEIRQAAFIGMNDLDSPLLGLLNFTDCHFFKIAISNKPIVHFKTPTKKDVNIYIRYLTVQQLIRLSLEAPDAEIRKAAKENLLNCLNRETELTILEILNTAIPISSKAKKKWLAETDNYAYKPSNKYSNFDKTEGSSADPLEKLSYEFFSEKSRNSSADLTPMNVRSDVVKQRSFSQKSLMVAPPLDPSEFDTKKLMSRSKRNSAPAPTSPKTAKSVNSAKKMKQIGDHQESPAGMQAILLAQCFDIDTQIVEQSIEFNQDIHLLDKNKLYITKAGIQKILQMVEEIKSISKLDFRQCQIQPEGIIYLAKKLPTLTKVNHLHLPEGLTKEAFDALIELYLNGSDLKIFFDSPRDDYQFGEYLIESGYVLDGIEYFYKGLDKLQNHQDQIELKVLTLIALGRAMLQQEKLDEAQKYFLEAYQVDPINFQVLSNLAALYSKKHDYVQAAKFYQEIKDDSSIEYEDIEMETLIDILNQQHQRYKPSQKT